MGAHKQVQVWPAIVGWVARLGRLPSVPRVAKMAAGPCLGHPKSWPKPAADGVCTAVLPRGSCLEGRAIAEPCKP